jgi:hypothetical protein
MKITNSTHTQEELDVLVEEAVSKHLLRYVAMRLFRLSNVLF